MGTGKQFPGRTVDGGKRCGTCCVHNIVYPGDTHMMGNPGCLDIQNRTMDRLITMTVGQAGFKFRKQLFPVGRIKGLKILDLVQIRPDFRVIIF